MLRKDSGAALPRVWSLTDLGVQVGGREQPVALISACFYCTGEQSSNDPSSLVHTINLP